MKRILLAILAGGICCAQTPPQVKVEAGLLQGTSENGLSVYRGIPFAAPTVGDLRWRPPQPAAKWQGLKPNAASFFKWGPGVCTQIVAKGYVVDSGRPNALGYRTVARPLQMRERARHRAIRAFQRHSWRRVPCKKGPPCFAASLCAHYGPPATRRRAH